MIALAAHPREPIVTVMHTAPTPTTAITTPARSRRRVVRRGTTAGLLALAIAAVAMPAARGTATNTPARPLGGCTLTPSADTAGFNVAALLMTVRMADGVIEMLHDVHCTDGRVGNVWITGHVI